MQQNNMFRNNRSFKIITVVALCVAVLCLSVAYATLSQNLNIQGTAEVQAANWKVVFKNAKTSTHSAGVEVSANSATDGATAITDLAITLKRPGDYGEFHVQAYNDGEIEAILDKFSDNNGKFTCEGTALDSDQKTKDEQLICGQAEDNSDASIKLTVTYATKEISKNSIVSLAEDDKQLSPSDYKDIVVRVEYLDTASEVPSSKVTVHLPDLTFSYRQNLTA